MRKLAFLSVAFALVAVSFYGCDESNPTEPRADPVVEAAFDWSNNSDNGNLRIFRGTYEGEFGFVICWSDAQSTGKEANGLRVCLANMPLAGGTEPDCGLQSYGEPLWYQDVGIHQDDSSWLRKVVKGEVFITVLDLTQAGDCFDGALVAEGYGNVRQIDNDALGPGNGANANVWKYLGNGNNLAATDGSFVSFNGHLQLRYNNNKDEFSVTSAKVDVH